MKARRSLISKTPAAAPVNGITEGVEEATLRVFQRRNWSAKRIEVLQARQRRELTEFDDAVG